MTSTEPSKTEDQEQEVDIEMRKVLASITDCVDRGEGRGRCHVFLNQSDICVCGQIDLAKERMK